MTFTPVMAERIYELLAQFKLPFASEQVVKRFEQAGCEDALPTLLEVLEAEAGGRSMRRSERLLRASRLPLGKTIATLDLERLPKPVVTQLHELATGAFLERTTNVLAFGLPGTGKTHAACAIGHELINRDTRCSSPRLSSSCRTCWPPSETSRYPARSASSTPTIC